MDAYCAELPLGVVVTQASDQADIVEHACVDFMQSFFEAPLRVRVISFLRLVPRFGIVIRQAMDLNFDRVTFGALIIALGFRSMTRSSLSRWRW